MKNKNNREVEIIVTLQDIGKYAILLMGCAFVGATVGFVVVYVVSVISGGS